MRTLTAFILTALGCVAVSAAEPAKQVTITTRPRFDERGQFTYLVVADDKHNYKIAWSMPPKVRFFPVSLEADRVYTFTIAEEPNERFKSDFRLPRLRKVQQDGQTIYDIEVCEIHKTKMEHKEVRIAYGLILPGPDAPSADTERQSFPHRREYSLGGCVVMRDSPKTERVYVCSECKKAYDKWQTDNKKTK